MFLFCLFCYLVQCYLYRYYHCYLCTIQFPLILFLCCLFQSPLLVYSLKYKHWLQLQFSSLSTHHNQIYHFAQYYLVFDCILQIMACFVLLFMVNHKLFFLFLFVACLFLYIRVPFCFVFGVVHFFVAFFLNIVVFLLSLLMFKLMRCVRSSS
jgi:hypothetical protein